MSVSGKSSPSQIRVVEKRAAGGPAPPHQSRKVHLGDAAASHCSSKCVLAAHSSVTSVCPASHFNSGSKRL